MASISRMHKNKFSHETKESEIQPIKNLYCWNAIQGNIKLQVGPTTYKEHHFRCKQLFDYIWKKLWVFLLCFKEIPILLYN